LSSRSDSRTSSDHWSALILIQCEHLVGAIDQEAAHA
jgi:hypothetical protein